MRTDADRLISKVYADLIYQVLEINAKPMQCKEISKEISEHSDFPKLSPQYVRRQMTKMLGWDEIVRIEKPVPHSKRKTIYFALPSVAEIPEEEATDTLVAGVVGGIKAFVIGKDGKLIKTLDSREK